MGCHLIVNSFSRSRKRVVVNITAVLKMKSASLMAVVAFDSIGVTQHNERNISNISSEPYTHLRRRISKGTETGPQLGR